MFVVMVLLYLWCFIIRDDDAAVVVKHQMLFISFFFRKQPHAFIFLFALLAKNAFYFFLFLALTVRFVHVSPAKMTVIRMT